MRLIHALRRPRYPLLCAAGGELVAARTKQELERRLARLTLPADGTLRAVDASGEGFAIHLALQAISPLTIEKTWTKRDVLGLYLSSTAGRREGLPRDEASLLRHRLDELIAIVVELVIRSARRAGGSRAEPPGSLPAGRAPARPAR